MDVDILSPRPALKAILISVSFGNISGYIPIIILCTMGNLHDEMSENQPNPWFLILICLGSRDSSEEQ